MKKVRILGLCFFGIFSGTLQAQAPGKGKLALVIIQDTETQALTDWLEDHPEGTPEEFLAQNPGLGSLSWAWNRVTQPPSYILWSLDPRDRISRNQMAGLKLGGEKGPLSDPEFFKNLPGRPYLLTIRGPGDGTSPALKEFTARAKGKLVALVLGNRVLDRFKVTEVIRGPHLQLMVRKDTQEADLLDGIVKEFQAGE